MTSYDSDDQQDNNALSEGEIAGAIQFLQEQSGLVLTSEQLTDLLVDWEHVRENIIEWGLDDPATSEDLCNALATDVLDEPWPAAEDAEALAEFFCHACAPQQASAVTPWRTKRWCRQCARYGIAVYATPYSDSFAVRIQRLYPVFF